MEVDAAEQLLVLCCFFANFFCEDFKSEINKVDEQRRFVITKGNDAG